MSVTRDDRSTGAGGELPRRLQPARPYAERRISRHGNSLSFAIPGAFLRNLNLLPGDTVRVVLYEESGGLFVQPLIRRAQLPPPPVTILPPADVSR